MTNEERAEIKSEGIIDVLSNLISVMEEENSILEEHKTKELKTTNKKKHKLSLVYKEYLKSITENPLWLKELDRDELQEIQELCKELEEISKINKMYLEVNMTANKKTAEIIIGCIKENQAKENTVYHSKGNLVDSCGNLANRKYLTLNESV